MTNSPSWSKYLTLLRKLSNTLEQLTGIEHRKTKAVSQGNLPVVEECMKQEQVLSLSLRSIDQKRERMLAAFGLTNIPLRQLVAHSPSGYELETKQVAEELRRQYTLFQAASQVARNTLECNLRQIEQRQTEKTGGIPTGDLPRQTDFRV